MPHTIGRFLPHASGKGGSAADKPSDIGMVQNGTAHPGTLRSASYQRMAEEARLSSNPGTTATEQSRRNSLPDQPNYQYLSEPRQQGYPIASIPDRRSRYNGTAPPPPITFPAPRPSGGGLEMQSSEGSGVTRGDITQSEWRGALAAEEARFDGPKSGQGEVENRHHR